MLMLRSFSRSSISYARSVMMLVVDQRNINKSNMVFEIKLAVSIKRGVLEDTFSSPWPQSLLIFENFRPQQRTALFFESLKFR